MGGVPGGTPGGGTPGGPPPPVDPCNTPECVGAKAKLATAKSDFTNACDRLRYVKNWLDILKPIVSTSIWWIVVLVIIAAILWLIGLGFLAMIIWLLILLYIISWFVFLALGRTAMSLSQALQSDLKAFEDAAGDVARDCPLSCQGDLTPPTCDVSYP